MISDALGGVDEWITSLDNLKQLMPFSKDKKFISDFMLIKKKNKERLRKWVKNNTDFDIPIDSLYDV